MVHVSARETSWVTWITRECACLPTPSRLPGGRLPVPVALARRRRIAVVGAGPAGLTAAERAARFGHEVTLFDRHAEPGGQFRLARRIPGKEEFGPALEHLAARAAASGAGLPGGRAVARQPGAGCDGGNDFGHGATTSGGAVNASSVDERNGVAADSALRGEPPQRFFDLLGSALSPSDFSDTNGARLGCAAGASGAA